MDAVRGVLLGGLCILAVGCGDGTTEPDDAPLTMNEAVALFEGMRVIQQDSTPRIIHASEDSTVVACPLGGQVRVTGSVGDTSVADTLRLETDFTAAPTGCQFSQGGFSSPWMAIQTSANGSSSSSSASSSISASRAR